MDQLNVPYPIVNRSVTVAASEELASEMRSGIAALSKDIAKLNALLTRISFVEDIVLATNTNLRLTLHHVGFFKGCVTH